MIALGSFIKTPMQTSSLSAFLAKINGYLRLEKTWFKKLTRAVWIIVLCMVLGTPLYIIAVTHDLFGLFGGMPSLKAIENPENDLSSEVISADGVSLGRYYSFNRSQISYDELSPVLVRTLLISEDHRFYEHSGLDLWAFARVLWGMVTINLQGGGSTLTQQTAKNLFSTRGDELQGSLAKLGGPFEILVSKTKEWIIAVELEKNFTKEEIIALYLNTVPFNNNAYGIKVAAETYFKKTPDKLNIQESALLVGMLQGTSWFNPIAHPERALNKRNEVLQKMLVHGYITSEQKADSIKAIPLQLNFTPQRQDEGPAPYFVMNTLQRYLQAWCKEHGYDLTEAGLKIHTTIDSRMQRYAEEAMTQHMSKLQQAFEREWGNRNPWVDDNNQEIKNFLQRKIRRSDTYRNLVKRYGADSDSVALQLREKRRMRVFTWNGDRDTLFSAYDSLKYYNRFLQTGLMSMDSETGAVKAWVGGIDYTYFQYDHVRQGTRQPGSTFKPFVYGLAMEEGYSPCQELYDISPTLTIDGKIYHPRNADGTYGDGKLYTLRQAMAKSLNSITIQMIDRLKPENVAKFAHKLGITSKLDPVYSLGLGTSNVSLYEMVAAYCSFANLGIYRQPYFITRIEDKNGNVLETFVPTSKQVMDEATAYKMIHMLKGGIEEEGGTSQSVSSFVREENEIGGKTGTTDNGSDGWYMGVTHNLVTGVWVGGDEPSIHFPRWGAGSGGKTALPIWDKYMTRVYQHPETGYHKGSFKQPSTDLGITLECDQFRQDSTFLTTF